MTATGTPGTALPGGRGSHSTDYDFSGCATAVQYSERDRGGAYFLNHRVRRVARSNSHALIG